MHTAIGALTAVLLTAPGSDAAGRAYLAAYRSDGGEARTIATVRLDEVPDDAGALFVAAAVEIEAGNFAAATERTALLGKLEPAPPEVAVLRALIDRRRRSPTERMSDALAEAWKASGRPDLAKRGVLKDVLAAVAAGAEKVPSVRPGDLGRLAPGEAFLLGALAHPLGTSWTETNATAEHWDELLATNAEWARRRANEATALAREPDANSLGVNVCVLSALSEREARRRVAAAIARALHGDGYVALAIALDKTPDEAPLTSDDLDAIDAAAGSSRFAWPFRAAYADVVRAARRLDPVRAELLARAAFGGCLLPSLSAVTLAHRAEATIDPALRDRAAGAAERVGKRLAQSAMMIDRMLGFVLRGTAAKIRNEPGRQAMLDGAEQWRGRLTAAGKAAGVDAWPLPSLWREWEPEEEVRYLELLER